MNAEFTNTLGLSGLLAVRKFQSNVIDAALTRLLSLPGEAREAMLVRGLKDTRDDLTAFMEFFGSALESGTWQALSGYLAWLNGLIQSMDASPRYFGELLQHVAASFASYLEQEDGAIVTAALDHARSIWDNESQAPASLDSGASAWPEARVFEAYIIDGQADEATAMVEQLLARGSTLVEIERHVIEPALYSVGDKWRAGKISVAQEHMATAIVHAALTMGLLQSSPGAPNSRSILLACVQGNRHEVGLRMAADAFQLAGWNIEYLGADVPTQSLIQRVKETKPDAVGLSLSFPQHMLVAREIIQELKRVMKNDAPPVILGGLAVKQFGDMAAMCGADNVFDSAEAAVEGVNTPMRS